MKMGCCNSILLLWIFPFKLYVYKCVCVHACACVCTYIYIALALGSNININSSLELVFWLFLVTMILYLKACFPELDINTFAPLGFCLYKTFFTCPHSQLMSTHNDSKAYHWIRFSVILWPCKYLIITLINLYSRFFYS